MDHNNYPDWTNSTSEDLSFQSVRTVRLPRLESGHFRIIETTNNPKKECCTDRCFKICITVIVMSVLATVFGLIAYYK